MRILVVEDEAKVARALREGLQREQYEVSIARTGEDGFFQMHAIRPAQQVKIKPASG